MKDLIRGVQQFRESYYSAHQELFEELSHHQTPRVLFISCSDSRVDPKLITQTEIGELFVIRNAGNIVPPYGSANGGEGAAIEYAISALGIEQVIICGHSHCGAMKGLLKLDKLQKDLPLVHEWLHHAAATLQLVRDGFPGYSDEELLEITVAENVLTQIDNLKTYPIVRSRLYEGKLQIYGWIYHIETGEVLAYDPVTHTYQLPQSQLAEYAPEVGPKPGAVFSTNAPPVVCEVPQARIEIARKAMATKTAKAQPKIDIPDGAQLSPWLPPEQAARIYQGSSH
jgi:carbonic anhydrase